jgi:hypothetical protein
MSVSTMHVYLAGPIVGCTQGEANDWRKDVALKLAEHNIVGISPLRCEPLRGKRYTSEYPDPRFGVPRAIAGKNKFDVMRCDIGIYYIPKPSKGRLHSFGTIGELFWADMADKQTILVTDDPFIMGHPVIDAASNWKLDNFRDAIDTVVGVLGGYVGGKNV